MIIYRFRPIVTKENDTYDGLYGVEYDEMTRANEAFIVAFKNGFIQSADLDGIRRFEKIYHISENPTFSLEDRRKIVYERMVYKPPFTRQRFDALLKNLFGEGNYSFELDAQNFTLVVSISQLDRNVYASYIKRIREIIPSNIYLIPSTPYTYLYLSGLIYGSNRGYTYVGAGNGDYNLVSNSYVYVGSGNGNYTLNAETDFDNESKLCHYTYRELSMYSVFDTTLELFAVDKAITIVEGEEVISSTKGEIVPLAGAGLAYVSEM